MIWLLAICHHYYSLKYQLVHSIHSSNGFLLQVPPVNTVTFGYHHFHIMHRKSAIVYLIISNTLNLFPLVFQATFETVIFVLETIIIHSLFKLNQTILSVLRML